MREKSNNIYVPFSLGVVVLFGKTMEAENMHHTRNCYVIRAQQFQREYWRFFKTTYNTNNCNSGKRKLKKNKK